MNSEAFQSNSVNRMNQFVHVVLTRFNVRTEFSLDAVPNEAWLEHRLQLFDRFAFPSMSHQVRKNFVWFVFLDKETSRPFRDRMQVYANECQNMVPVYVESIKIGTPENLAMLRPLIAPHINDQTTHLISTRFDNDDAVSDEFLATIQKQFTGQTFEFINLPNGYLWQNSKLYTKSDQSNPFMSLIESASDFKTVWCASHHIVESYGQVRQVDSTPQWIQVIHGKNVSNRVRVGNIRLPIKSLPATFQLSKQISSKQEAEWGIKLENMIKKRVRRFRWKWKQFRQRYLTNPSVE